MLKYKDSGPNNNGSNHRKRKEATTGFMMRLFLDLVSFDISAASGYQSRMQQ